MRPLAFLRRSNLAKTGLMVLFAASLVVGILAGELTLIRIESATL